MSQSQSQSPVLAFFAACGDDDVRRAAECFADDGVWIAAEGDEPGRTHKRSELEDFIAEVLRKRDELHAAGAEMAFGEHLVVADKEILEFTVTSRDGGILERGVDIFTIRDGKIACKDVFRKA
ncbi:nuclear transport factor 2 family protein [Streptomyces sp. NBC_00882]|uniref:nuclear transport factor 2 family protein n=1 Tax=Streptomyces TaxID=1883 RepID=UPI00386C895F|nr:nuclear transport factor 2 family protein [Streptomyces sp. NBC_00882]WSZ55103.1 nuclear transport factor 2 family protein [Streptomyces canus]